MKIICIIEEKVHERKFTDEEKGEGRNIVFSRLNE